MIKKAYYKPTMKVVRIKPTMQLMTASVETEGLDGEELNDNGGEGNMESAAM